MEEFLFTEICSDDKQIETASLNVFWDTTKYI